jgi:integrase
MKSTVRLTAANVKTLPLPKGKSEIIYRDSEIPGLGLRIRASDTAGKPDTRVLIFSYSRPGGTSKSPKHTLGKVGGLDITDARLQAKKLYAEVMAGGDPLLDKAETRSKAVETFGAVAALYLGHKRATVRANTYVDIERHILKHAETLHPLPMARLERRSVAAVVTRVSQESGRPRGNRVLVSLNTFFVWALGQGLIDHNPCTGIVKNPERARDRVLSPKELRIIWRALGDDHFGCILRLLMLTGQREGEISGLRWSEVRDNAIHLPAERTKNHRAHVVPLSRAALAIIQAQPHRVTTNGQPRDLIFGLGEGPFSGWGAAKEKLDALVGLEPWRIHDLRRSFVTHAAENGIAQPHIIEAAVNHVSGHRGGVAGVYNHATYAREVRIALDRWAEWLLAVVEDRESNVVSLPRQA